MLRFRQFIAEAFDKPFRWKEQKSSDPMTLLYNFKTSKGDSYQVVLEDKKKDRWNLSFARIGDPTKGEPAFDMGLTGSGEAFRVFATVLEIVGKFAKERNPWKVSFSAAKLTDTGEETQSRSKLYNRMVTKFAGKLGYNVTIKELNKVTQYRITRKGN